MSLGKRDSLVFRRNWLLSKTKWLHPHPLYFTFFTPSLLPFLCQDMLERMLRNWRDCFLRAMIKMRDFRKFMRVILAESWESLWTTWYKYKDVTAFHIHQSKNATAFHIHQSNNRGTNVLPCICQHCGLLWLWKCNTFFPKTMYTYTWNQAAFVFPWLVSP